MTDNFDMPVDDLHWGRDGLCLSGTVASGEVASGQTVLIRSPLGGTLVRICEILASSNGTNEFDTSCEKAAAGRKFMLLFSTSDVDVAALGYDREQHRMAKSSGRPYLAAKLRICASPADGAKIAAASHIESAKGGALDAAGQSYYRLAFNADHFKMLCGYLYLALLATSAALFHKSWGDDRIQAWQTEFYACEFFACLMVGWLGGVLASVDSTRERKQHAVRALAIATGVVALGAGVVAASLGAVTLIWTAPVIVLSIFGTRVWHAAMLIDANRDAGLPMFIQGVLGALALFFLPVILAAQLRYGIVGRSWLIALDYAVVGLATFGLLYLFRYQYLKNGIDEGNVRG
jgi:hypothetical protein